VQFFGLLVTLLFPHPSNATHLLVSIADPLNSSSNDDTHTRPNGSPTGCNPDDEVEGGVFVVVGVVLDELVLVGAVLNELVGDGVVLNELVDGGGGVLLVDGLVVDDLVGGTDVLEGGVELDGVRVCP
jgi:hypothetical protein